MKLPSRRRETSGAFRQYWGSHQSFFKQLLNSVKAKFAIAEAQSALEGGKCVVIGLLTTGEAKANEAAERESRAGRELDSEVANAQCGIALSVGIALSGRYAA